MTIEFVVLKSSAVSVWIPPALGGRETVAIFPSGLPVEKEKEPAEACPTSSSEARAPTAVLLVDSPANTKGFSQRRVGVSFVVCFLSRLFIITYFLVYFISRF